MQHHNIVSNTLYQFVPLDWKLNCITLPLYHPSRSKLHTVAANGIDGKLNNFCKFMWNALKVYKDRATNSILCTVRCDSINRKQKSCFVSAWNILGMRGALWYVHSEKWWMEWIVLYFESNGKCPNTQRYFMNALHTICIHPTKKWWCDKCWKAWIVIYDDVARNIPGNLIVWI